MAKNSIWQEELICLKEIIAKTELKEANKWGIPVYTYNDKNIVGIAGFKSYFGLWFYNGVFLKDESNKLVNANEEKTKSLRQWRFYSSDEIDESLILKYIKEAIEIEEKGLKIEPQKKKVDVPDLLKNALNEDAYLKKAFNQFTPYKQKEFFEYITSAKREITKQNRLEKIIPLIKDGVGLNDKYR